VIEEVKYVLRELPGVKEIFFDDDTLHRQSCRASRSWHRASSASWA
jgi:hypothetical protein